MNRNLLLMMGATAALAIATAQACTVETTDGTGGGTSTGSNTTNTGGSGTTTSSTAGVGGMGTGGSVECQTCGEYITNVVSDPTLSPDVVCDDPANDEDDSAALFNALVECTCSSEACAALCANTCTGSGDDSEGSTAEDDCGMCQVASITGDGVCVTEGDACSSDI